MTSDAVREKYLKFFESRGHVQIPPAPLVLENDPTTLFTSAGMQPLIPYLKGEPHPRGKRLVDIQPSIRLQDIDEVGDNRHTTFFEMLGNWSLGDYFKKEQLTWVWEFFTKELGLDPEKLYVSVFEGTKDVPKDEESYKIWKDLGVPDERIFFYGVKKNWWSRTGEPETMPAGEIGGPDSEVFYDFAKELKIHENSVYKDEKCHPNCECGRFLEIGNSVFIQYERQKSGSLKELPNKNVDFGGGLERITAAVNNEPDVFKTDSFWPSIVNLEEFVGKKYGESQKVDANYRIISDHLRVACYLLAEGVIPGNKLQGYVVRRLIRRAVFRLRLLGFDLQEGAISTLARPFANNFEIIEKNWSFVKDIMNTEAVKFNLALNRGTAKLNRLMEEKKITGKSAFDLYQTEGFPLELTLEILEEKGWKFSEEDKTEFEQEFKKHQELSRTASAGMFKGGLVDSSQEVTKLHTATHLLHAALRKVLGEHVSQKGSNITGERLRFDFSHPQKLTDEEIRKVEEIVNEQIEEDLPVTFEEKSLDEAIAEGALHFFAEKYGSRVKVYTIGDFSKEVCGGPHVSHTGELGHVKIVKQEKVGAGVIRIYAKTE
jgi:alanyl-tRNA synthetase